MARPQRIEKLRHGRLLCGSAFRFFVETWNWLTAYVDNMKGDAETDPQSGYITIDRTDPDHPVIRFRADKAAGGGGESVVPDDVSTEFIPDPPGGTPPDGDEGKLQIKEWRAGTPVSSYTVAQDIARDNADGNSVVVRSSSGTLEYKPIGTLAQLTGSTVTGTKTVLTGLTWDTTNHTLVISSANVVYSKGIVTSWTANADGTIATTGISTIIGS